MVLASEAASKLSHPAIDAAMGTFLLGSTSPDIRIMTKWARDDTHFAPLSISEIGAGVQGLFQKHPALAAPNGGVSDATRVFLAGYITHLVADEAWILEIYRTYFDGPRDPRDRVVGNIWDRALQLDMDMAAREEMGDMAEVRRALEGAEEGVAVDFIDSETLSRWREWVSEFTTWEYSWDRLRGAARRMYKDSTEAADLVEEFLSCVPKGLERVHRLVPREKIAEYRRTAVEESTRLVGEYLDAP
jgi:hypothetical protein